MRFIGLILWLLTLSAQPAFAQSLPLLSVRQQLNQMIGDRADDVGIAALDLKTGEMISVQGDEPFPMASTVKVAIAANYLAQVEHGRRTLDQTIRGRSASSLMAAMLIHSDNIATDILLRDLGGPATIQRWLSQNQMSGIRVDRTIAQLLHARRDLRDIRDSSTPKAMVALLQRIDSGSLLMPESRSYLLGLMGRCMTGRNRIRGMLPAGTRVEHKTGTLDGFTSDVGFITMPDGRRVAVAMFARSRANRPQLIARAARAIYDGFALAFRAPLTISFAAP